MASGDFLHFFPTPRFLRMPTAGLDISDDAIRFIELRADRGSFLLEKHDQRELPYGVIQNGTIQDSDKLIAALSAIREANDLKFVRVSLPEEKSYLYHDIVPFVPDESEMRESISFTIEENVPLSAEEVVFDYDVIIPNDAGGIRESEEVGVVVSVLPIDVVSDYLDVIVASGLHPLSLMVESQAVAKAVVPRDNPDTVLIVNVREEKTAVYIVYNNTVHFTSAFSTKGGSVSAPLSFVDDDEKEGGEQAGKEGLENEESFIEQDSQTIISEIKRVVRYWGTHAVGKHKGNEITKVVVCGSQAGNLRFKHELESELKLTTQTANVWVNALSFDTHIPSIPADEALHFAAAIGLALPEYR